MELDKLNQYKGQHIFYDHQLAVLFSTDVCVCCESILSGDFLIILKI